MFLFRRPTNRQIDVALALLRVFTGITFFAHGYQKVFTFGLGGISGFFGQAGIPMPGVMGPFIALLELVGGVALILGVLTRVVGFLLACDMLGAFLFVHAKGGFFLPKGFEFVFVLFAMSAALAIAGGGAFSADDAIARRRPEP